jgi:hypothetical protein
MKRRPLGRARAPSHGGSYESADAGIELAPRILGTPEPEKATKPGEWGHGKARRDQDMTRRTGPVLLIGAMLLVAGCAGRAFVRPSPDVLMLGKTSYEDVLRQLGDPYREGSSLREGQTVTSITYAYANAWATSGFGNVTPARSMTLSFVHDVLVGYDFTSSYTEDLTDFDETRVAQIRTGETKQSEVEQLLGAAGGMYAYPLIRRGPERALVYLYAQTRTKPFSVDVYLKRLVVSVDGNGIVTDVDFNTSGEK